MIEAQGLTRYYGDFPALRDASFSIQSGEIVGFLGLNGAGKSTVLKILAGLLLPSAGKVTVDGVDATERPDELRQKIGFLPEEPPLYLEMRVRDFLRWVGQLKGRGAAQIERDLPAVLDTCELHDVADRVIGELSHGFKKRVGIAQAIIHGPDVVILDEPISGLDPKQIVEMRDVVRSLKERATVLISSHILSEISLTCERVFVIHEGRLVKEGTTRDLGQKSSEGRRVRLELRGQSRAIAGVFDASKIVVDSELTEGERGITIANVELTGDHREQLVAELAAKEIGVRGVSDAVSELEQIFLEFTRTHATAGRGRPKVKA